MKFIFNDMTVAVKNLFCVIKGKAIIDDVSFSFTQGEILGVLGPSGSGKTTLLRHIIGELVPTSGVVTIDDKEVPYVNMASDLGYMPQDIALYEDISAYDNLKFFSNLYNIKNTKERIEELLIMMDLAGHSKKIVANYSGGMKRRLSLAVTLLHKPKFLILDEPTVGIDPVLREKIWEMINQLKKQGSYIIVTTHVMNDVERCDKVLILKDGKIVALNTLDALKLQYKTETAEGVFLQASQTI